MVTDSDPSPFPHEVRLLILHLIYRLSINCWSFSCAKLLGTPWTVARQAPLCLGILQAGILEWVAIPFSMGSS